MDSYEIPSNPRTERTVFRIHGEGGNSPLGRFPAGDGLIVLAMMLHLRDESVFIRDQFTLRRPPASSP